jgi:pimeloyl-ACP methyl ester carboxylesterase
MTPEHVRAFARRVTAPVLLLFAEQSPFVGRELYREMPQLFANIEIGRLPGGHHFHLEGTEAVIAERIRRFLGTAG